ncbi:flagellar hook-length control protein FliK [Oceaniglobus ichthyenteri]|uniref:flagellar hook-length control protein FliK n=1 Tax=Oceaniglobus ichthyenteri TaxID=2136177 RepID=UPI000D34E119|nr:flagellar hook-length control protein FliK [Oceaniglobus ichthyenteri]
MENPGITKAAGPMLPLRRQNIAVSMSDSAAAFASILSNLRPAGLPDAASEEVQVPLNKPETAARQPEVSENAPDHDGSKPVETQAADVKSTPQRPDFSRSLLVELPRGAGPKTPLDPVAQKTPTEEKNAQQPLNETNQSEPDFFGNQGDKAIATETVGNRDLPVAMHRVAVDAPKTSHLSNDLHPVPWRSETVEASLNHSIPAAPENIGSNTPKDVHNFSTAKSIQNNQGIENPKTKLPETAKGTAPQLKSSDSLVQVLDVAGGETEKTGAQRPDQIIPTLMGAHSVTQKSSHPVKEPDIGQPAQQPTKADQASSGRSLSSVTEVPHLDAHEVLQTGAMLPAETAPVSDGVKNPSQVAEPAKGDSTEFPSAQTQQHSAKSQPTQPVGDQGYAAMPQSNGGYQAAQSLGGGLGAIRIPYAQTGVDHPALPGTSAMSDSRFAVDDTGINIAPKAARTTFSQPDWAGLTPERPAMAAGSSDASTGYSAVIRSGVHGALVSGQAAISDPKAEFDRPNMLMHGLNSESDAPRATANHPVETKMPSVTSDAPVQIRQPGWQPIPDARTRSERHEGSAVPSESGSKGTAQILPPLAPTAPDMITKLAGQAFMPTRMEPNRPEIQPGDQSLGVTTPHDLRVGGAAAVQGSPGAPQTTPATAVLQQLVQVSGQLGHGQVEVTLSPEELGRVRMTLSAAENGLILSISADRDDTLALLRRNLESLAADLHDLGFENLSFQFGSGQSDRHSDHASGGAVNSGADDQPDGLKITPAAQYPTSGPQSDRLDLRL